MTIKCKKNFRNPITKCDKNIYENWDYCKEHGCKNCKEVVRKTKGGIAIEDGFWVCSENCKNELVKTENQKRIDKLLNLNNEITTRLSAIGDSDFFANLKELINELFLNKCAAIHSNNKTPATIITISLNLENAKNLIDGNEALNSPEKEEWKSFYEENQNEDLYKLTEMEEEFLFRLISKNNIKERERERESKKAGHKLFGR